MSDQAGAGEPMTETNVHPFLWDAIGDTDGDSGGVGVPDDSPESRFRAALSVFDVLDPDWIGWSEHRDECAEVVGPLMKPTILREHLTEPYHEHDEECGPEDAWTCGEEERCCGCEDIGWVCTDGDGDPHLYLWIDRTVMDDAIAALRLGELDEESGDAPKDAPAGSPSGDAASRDSTSSPDRALGPESATA